MKCMPMILLLWAFLGEAAALQAHRRLSDGELRELQEAEDMQQFSWAHPRNDSKAAAAFYEQQHALYTSELEAATKSGKVRGGQVGGTPTNHSPLAPQ